MAESATQITSPDGVATRVSRDNVGSYSRSNNADPSYPRRKRSISTTNGASGYMATGLTGDDPADMTRPIRRRSSVYDAIQDMQSDILAPAAKENVNWNNIPLAMAILPAVSGLFFTNGVHFMADIILLFLAATFLHWLIKFPWDWYHESQSFSIDPDPFTAVISEEDESTTKDEDSDATIRISYRKKIDHAKFGATIELERNRRIALLCCFLGPLLGAWLLHTIRTQLSRPGESLLSNFNISVFVLGAELRPSAQVIKMIKSHTIYLQNAKYRPPPSKVEEVTARLEKLSSQVETLMMSLNKEDEMVGSVKKGIQPDLDALNRAVRRYERKEAVQTAQTEEKLAYLDRRVNDVLTLAAAAAASAQESRDKSFFHILTSWIAWTISGPFVLLFRIVGLPMRAVESVAMSPWHSKAGKAIMGRHANIDAHSGDGSTRKPKQLSDGRVKQKGKPRFA